MIETNFKIDGMSCGGCVRSVTNVLKALPGVEVDSVTVGGAQLRMAPDETIEKGVVKVDPNMMTGILIYGFAQSNLKEATYGR